EMGTDPLAPDTLGVQTVFEAIGASAVAQSSPAASNSFGGWEADGQLIYSLGPRGWLEYTLTAPQADMYRLELAGASHNPHDPEKEFELQLWLDGEYLGRSILTATNETVGMAHQLTPWIRAGDHRLRIFW